MPNNDERRYFVFCEDKCIFEALTKEQTINAIAEATGTVPESIDVDAAFITKIKEMNANKNLKFWIGTTAQFQALQTKQENTLYIFTDDDTVDSWEEMLRQVSENAENINKILEGNVSVGYASHATNADHASQATNANFSTGAGHSYYAENLEPPFIEKQGDGYPITACGLYACVWGNRANIFKTEMISVAAENWTGHYQTNSTGDNFYYDGYGKIKFSSDDEDDWVVEVRKITIYQVD